MNKQPPPSDLNDFPLTKGQMAEIGRLVRDIDDPTRYAIVSAFSRRMCLFYAPSDGMFIGDEIPETAMFKRKTEAEAVRRVLEGRRRKNSMGLQILELKKTKKGIFVVGTVTDYFGDRWRPRLKRR